MPQGSVTSPLTSYDLVVGVIVDIENIIVQLDPADVPFLGMNGADGRAAIPRDTCFEKRKDWLDDTLLAPRTAGLTADLTNVATSATLNAADANRFPNGSVLLIDSEYILVTAVDTTGTVLTITRGFAGSTAAAHNGVTVPVAQIIGVGMALAEGSQPGVARSIDRNNRFNLTQIFGPHLVSTSATENAVRKYGLSGTNEFNYQAGQRAKEAYISIEQSIAYGVQFDDTANKRRTMGGFVFYVTTNVDSTTTALTEQTLLNQHQAIWKAGGNPKHVMVGPKQKRVISNFNSDTSGGVTNILRRPAGDNVRGEVVDTYLSDFGVLQVFLNRWLRDSDLFIYDRDQLALATLRPMQFEMLAKTGDSLQGQIVAEHTLVVRRQKHAARFSALT